MANVNQTAIDKIAQYHREEMTILINDKLLQHVEHQNNINQLANQSYEKLTSQTRQLDNQLDRLSNNLSQHKEHAAQEAAALSEELKKVDGFTNFLFLMVCALTIATVCLAIFK